MRLIVVVASLLTIVAGFAAVALSRVGVEEHPPCRACLKPRSELCQVSVCELVGNRQMLMGKPVRVAARFRNDAAQLFLVDGGCSVIVGFAQERQACRGAWRKLQVVCGVDTWYDGSGSVRVMGSLSTIPDGNYYVGRKDSRSRVWKRCGLNPFSSSALNLPLASCY